jgi:hypothetical protein
MAILTWYGHTLAIVNPGRPITAPEPIYRSTGMRQT